VAQGRGKPLRDTNGRGAGGRKGNSGPGWTNVEWDEGRVRGATSGRGTDLARVGGGTSGRKKSSGEVSGFVTYGFSRQKGVSIGGGG